MDPVSIAMAAATVAKALFITAKQIADFRSAAAVVDQSVAALESLSRGLAGVLENLHKVLEHPVLNDSENAEYWVSVHDSITACKSTIKELDDKLAPLSHPGANGAQQAWRAARLSSRQPEIDRFVANMTTHSINLQLGLQTVNVIIIASIPDAISASQTAGFDRLERMIVALRRHVEPVTESAGEPLQPEAPKNDLPVLAINTNTRELYLSAATVVSGSVGGTIRSASSGIRVAEPALQQPTFEDFASAGLAIPIGQGSEAGVPLDDTERARIRDWMDDSPIERSVTNGPPSDSEDDLDEEPDDHLYFKVAESSFTRGMDNYRQEQFSEAREYLNIGIEKAKVLSDDQKKQLDLPSKQFHHALCCIVQSTLFEEAEKSFRLVAEGSGSRENDAQLQCFALYQLARVLLKMNKLRSAEKYCKRAVKSMKKEQSIGETHAAYFDSLRLLVLILWAKGLKFEAKAVSDLLPTSHQITEDALDEELATILAVDVTRNSGSDHANGSLNEPTLTPQSSVNGDLSPRQPSSARDSQISVPPRSNSVATALTLETTFTGETNSSSVDSSTPTRLSSVATGLSFATTSTNATSVPSIAWTERSYSQDGDRVAATRVITSMGFHERTGVNKGVSWAAKHGRLDVLEILLRDPHADVNPRRSGWRSTQETPLMVAAAKGHYEICQRLLKANAAVDIISKGKSALDWAIDSQSFDICRLLLASGASPDCAEGEDISPLALAARKGYLSICQVLFDFNADINENNFERTKDKRTALMQAASLNNVNVMGWYLEHGASVDGPKPAVTTPLIEAARAHAVDACRLLLTHGANVDLRTNRKMTAGRAASSEWLKGFITKWPESRTWTAPQQGMTMKP